MQGQTHTFEIGANSDDDVRVIPPGEYRRAFHLRSGTATDGNEFSRETYAGNLLLTNNSLPAGTNIVLGSCPDVETSSIIYLVYNSNSNHQIWKFNTNTQLFTLVIQSSFLNFSASDFIAHALVVNGVLYWCMKRLSSFTNSNFSEPKNIDIAQAILFTAGSPSAYTTITRQTFDFVKWPPVYGPAVAYTTDLTQEANFLYGRMYKFRYKYIYLNNEQSALSPYSEVPLPTNAQFVQGRDWAATQDDNVLQLTLQTGPDLVKKIICYVSINDGPVFEFAQLDKALLGIGNNTTYVVSYVGNETLQAIGYAPANYDAVPLTAGCMEYLSSTRQICFGNFIEGFNKEAVGATIEVVPVEIPKGEFRNTPVGYIYNIGTLQSFISIAGNLLQVPDAYVMEGDTYTFITTYLSVTQTIQYSLTAADIVTITGGATPALRLQALIDILGGHIDSVLGIVGAPAVYAGANAYAWAGLVIFSNASFSPALNLLRVNPVPRRNEVHVGLFKGAVHEFGRQYYDRANRDGTVITSDVLSLYVPSEVEQDRTDFFDPQSPYYALSRMNITIAPPLFATHYQIVHRRVPVINFQERTGINIAIDTANASWLKISLDPFATNINGAIIGHNIQKGDIVRFIRRASTSGPTADYGDYCETYVEVIVEDYNPTGGVNNYGFVCESISVANFDWQGLLGGFNGFILQIYTPAKKDENALWREISEEFSVLNAHTSTRAHQGSVLTGTASDLVTGSNVFSLASFLVGTPGTNFDYIIGRSFTIVADVPYAGTITNAVFNPVTQITTITANTNFTGANTNGSVTILLNQVSGGLSAIVNILYGDTYTRLRQMSTGYSGPVIDQSGIYPIDSFDYSDYYPSKINSEGRIAVENADARQVDLKATIRHGGSFIDNSQVNNLCMFDQTNLSATLALDETFGPINKMIMNGYTLKCLQDRKENSVYIKATFGVLPGGGSVQTGFTPESQTFGGWNPSESLYGTIHPFSVQLFNGMLFYYDYYSSTVVRSLNNGQQDICSGEYKYSRAIQDFKINLDLITRNTDWVSSYIDEMNGEYGLMSFNRTNGNNVLSYVFNFDRNRWDHELRYTAFMTCRLGNYLVSWPRASAQLYKHNAGSENTFYGTQYASSLTYITNDGPEFVKRPLSVGLKTNAVWGLTALTEANASYPAMATTIFATDFELLEGYYWSKYYYDETNIVVQIPALATAALARVNSRKELRGYALINTITVTPSTRVKIFSAKTNYQLSEMPL